MGKVTVGDMLLASAQVGNTASESADRLLETLDALSEESRPEPCDFDRVFWWRGIYVPDYNNPPMVGWLGVAKWLREGFERRGGLSYGKGDTVLTAMAMKLHEALGQMGEYCNRNAPLFEQCFDEAVFLGNSRCEPTLSSKLLRLVGMKLEPVFQAKYRELPKGTLKEVRKSLLQGYFAAVGEEEVYRMLLITQDIEKTARRIQSS